MADITEIATSMLGIGIALSMLLMGLLISYYGSSKTRNVGFLFLIIGAALVYFVTSMEYEVVLMESMLAFIGGMLGGIIGLIIFLVAIIKS